GKHGYDPEREAIYREPSSRRRYAMFREHWAKRRKKAKKPLPETADTGLASDQDWLDRGRLRKDKGTRRRYLSRYYQWLRPYRSRLISLTVVGLIISAMDLFMPWASGRMLDMVATDDWSAHLPAWFPRPAEWGRGAWLVALAAAALVVIVIGRLLGLMRNLAMQKLNAQVTFRLRSQLYEHIVRLPLGDLHEMKSGGVISRLSTDVDNTIGLVQQAVLSPLAAVIRLLLTSIVLFMISWQVTLVALFLLVGCGLLYNRMLRTVRPIYRSMGEDRARIDGRVAETFGGVRVVRAFAREHKEELEYAVGHHTAIRKQLWARAVQQVLHLFWELLMPLTGLSIMAIGSWLVLRDELSPGGIITIQMLSFQVLNPVFLIVNSMSETQRSLAAMERVYEVLERPQEKPDRPAAAGAPSRIDEIAFEQVDFAYGEESFDGTPVELPPDTKLVLKSINLRVPGGSLVAFVGPSGAGKTTMTDLLARYHDPSAGRISINGKDLRDYRLTEYRDLLAIVQQETFLFDGTVRENIAYARRDASEAELLDAARRANALEFIEELPLGFDSVIGERGVKLSGGQRQRLSIARAILADPKILILDEATSNLDTQSEQLIQQAMEELFAGRTTFVVAHRLSTIHNADVIVVIDQGSVVEQGTHAELMAKGKGGSYFDMVMRQRTRDAWE
ncbi:MAG: ABC transporter ATP-binding protein, partial [Planctomycetota bacterium]|nr:ABC transporter ATP-binding protein [Planctomycetota bacterium]